LVSSSLSDVTVQKIQEARCGNPTRFRTASCVDLDFFIHSPWPFPGPHSVCAVNPRILIPEFSQKIKNPLKNPPLLFAL
jgi:hypothetical protein